MIRLTIVLIEFCGLADHGEARVEEWPGYADVAVWYSRAFPFARPDAENIPQLLPCPN